MRNPNRIPIILKKIGLIWEKNPDLRLGQLLCNVTSVTEKLSDFERIPFYNIEDDYVEKRLDEYLKK